MGDAEVKIENEIKTNVSADVIKVGHHGSISSSGQSFVNRVKPKYAIISVGKNNSYNHPNLEIIKRWQDIGAKVYRTDEAGTIIVTSNGTQISILCKQTSGSKIEETPEPTETPKPTSKAEETPKPTNKAEETPKPTSIQTKHQSQLVTSGC